MKCLARCTGAFLRRSLIDRRGASAIEFALILPVMLVALVGGYQVTQALSAYRKTTITTRTVADLATQYTSMSTSDMSTVLKASAQVMDPFSETNLSIVLTEFTAPLAVGKATVVWSKKLSGGQVSTNSAAQSETLPIGVCQPGASVVRADITYSYTPPIGYKLIGTITMRDSLYMSPRQTKTITYTGS